MIPNCLPTVDEVENFAPEVLVLADRYAAETLAGRIDFDLEIFDAIDAYLQGATPAEALSHISPEHPGAEEAAILLSARFQQRLIA